MITLIEIETSDGPRYFATEGYTSGSSDVPPNQFYENRIKSARLISGDYHRTIRWGSDLALKDYGHAKSLAEEFVVKTKGLDLVADHLRAVSEYARQGEGKKGDIAGVYGVVRQEAGLKFEM